MSGGSRFSEVFTVPRTTVSGHGPGHRVTSTRDPRRVRLDGCGDVQAPVFRMLWPPPTLTPRPCGARTSGTSRPATGGPRHSAPPTDQHVSRPDGSRTGASNMSSSDIIVSITQPEHDEGVVIMTERSMDQVDNSAVVDETLIEEVSIDGMCGVY
ncbi:hypothetical protein NFA_34410 [Nocardia farcinica IFM 10152]|uniref:Mycofactocin n=2 Tax=Nocardia farcinica TaxID=37329 RepID=Q5YU52_NOCFA|nr:hypothetical protein NFA_34410 [Nocardia farcinica IFM 10152]